ncbi:EcsC family protein [Cytobacillus horneckiae]|uniref:EcsC family protein n=1 Tax=Cytobacillus horneckiae TaxID=549687 RepID=UPI003D9A4472
METIEELQKKKEECERWEKDQSGLWFWEKIGRIPFKFLDKLTPAFIQKKVGVILDELGHYVQSGGQYLSSSRSLTSYYPKKNIQSFSDLNNLSIEEMDQAVSKLATNRKRFATIQGASTGAGGIFTLSIDVPVLLGTQLKTLQDIAICYGYDPNEKKERLFIVKILQFVSADIVGKETILKQLSRIDDADAAVKREVVSELQGWREVVLAYRDNIGWKKLFQIIPIAGFLFGAFINRSSVSDIAEAGMMFYRKRKIQERIRTYKSTLQ